MVKSLVQEDLLSIGSCTREGECTGSSKDACGDGSWDWELLGLLPWVNAYGVELADGGSDGIVCAGNLEFKGSSKVPVGRSELTWGFCSSDVSGNDNEATLVGESVPVSPTLGTFFGLKKPLRLCCPFVVGGALPTSELGRTRFEGLVLLISPKDRLFVAGRA